jgi:hypothetical protein
LKKRSALSLTVLLSKVVQLVPGTETIIYCLDFVVKFYPNNQRDFDCLFLYFFALELVDSNDCDLKNTKILEKIAKLEYNLSFLGSVYTNDLLNISKKINKLKINNELKSSKIQPPTSLGCRTIDLVLSHILFV